MTVLRYTLRSLFATPMRDAHFCTECYKAMLEKEARILRSASGRMSPWAITNRARSEALSVPHRSG